MAARHLAHVDSLRVALIVLVLAHHAAQPYGPTGGAWPVTYPDHSAWLGPFFTVNSSFFMGLFFMVAGYFSAAGCARRGPWGFLLARAIRLGLPALLVGFILLPVALYLLSGDLPDFWTFYADGYIGQWQVDFAHAWFLLHLLAYSALLCLAAVISPGILRPMATASVPNALILGVMAAMAVATYLIRLDYPVDRWVTLGFVLPVEPAHFPQYAILFFGGVLAGRSRLIERMPTGQAFGWLRVGLALAALPYAIHALEIFGVDVPRLMASGGESWQAAVRAVWEAALSVSLAIGLPVLFRQWLAAPSPLSRLAPMTMTVYIVHVFVVVVVQVLLAPTGLPALAMFALVTALGTAASFAIAFGWHRVCATALPPRRSRADRTA